MATQPPMSRLSFNNLRKVLCVKPELVFEVVVDGLGDQRSGIFRWHLFDLEDDAKVAFLRKLQRPIFQKLFGIRIEIAMMERRRIHRIEKF